MHSKTQLSVVHILGLTCFLLILFTTVLHKCKFLFPSTSSVSNSTRCFLDFIFSLNELKGFDVFYSDRNSTQNRQGELQKLTNYFHILLLYQLHRDYYFELILLKESE